MRISSIHLTHHVEHSHMKDIHWTYQFVINHRHLFKGDFELPIDLSKFVLVVSTTVECAMNAIRVNHPIGLYR